MKKHLQQRAMHIILVEDCKSDVTLVTQAFLKSKVENYIHVAYNGADALKMIRRVGEHAKIPMIDLILLDLNLPDQHGLEVIKTIKSDPKLAKIPVIALSGEDSVANIEAVNKHMSSNFIAKPQTLERLVEIVRVIERCWFGAIQRREKGSYASPKKIQTASL